MRFLLGSLFISFTCFAFEDLDKFLEEATSGPVDKACGEAIAEAEADPKVVNCEGRFFSVMGDRWRAIEESKTAAMLLKTSKERIYFDNLIKRGYKKFFKLDSDNAGDQASIQKVDNLIIRIANKIDSAKFSCGGLGNSIFCALTGNPLAAVPPGKGIIHLCDSYHANQDEFDDKKRSGTLIHEAFHMFGGKDINYVPETYCGNSEKLSSDDLIKNADQYMLFISYLAHKGNGLECY